MSDRFAERLLALARARSPATLGIDPRLDWLPEEYRSRNPARALEAFAADLIDIAAPSVAAVKVQIAYFEALGPDGLRAYQATLARVRAAGLVAIGDVKRGDIGSTAEAYAAAHLAPGAPFEADAVTLSPYFGEDGLKPFLDLAAGTKGVFVLVKTSNPGGREVQDIPTQPDGEAHFLKVADLVDRWSGPTVGPSGYGAVGAVVGATYPGAAAVLRERLPRSILLAPGYGAQGAGAADLAPFFDARGDGALVSASRSVIYAWRTAPGGGSEVPGRWRDAVAAAVSTLARDARSAAARPREPA